jgi:hypothetical protein
VNLVYAISGRKDEFSPTEFTDTVTNEPAGHPQQHCDDIGHNKHNSALDHEAACYRPVHREIRVFPQKVIDAAYREQKGNGTGSVVSKIVDLLLTWPLEVETQLA